MKIILEQKKNRWPASKSIRFILLYWWQYMNPQSIKQLVFCSIRKHCVNQIDANTWRWAVIFERSSLISVRLGSSNEWQRESKSLGCIIYLGLLLPTTVTATITTTPWPCRCYISLICPLTCMVLLHAYHA